MDKLDLLASFMQAKSYGYLIGVFSEVQAQQTFSDPAKKTVVIVLHVQQLRAYLREAYVLQNS